MKLCLRCGSSFHGTSWKCPTCGWTPEAIGGLVAFAPDLAQDNEYYDSEHHGRLAALEAGNFWFRARNELILWALDKFFCRAQRMIEIGCGTGFVLKALEDARPHSALVGTEIHVSGLEIARQRVTARTELLQLDATRLPFRDEFEVAGAFDVIEHIHDDEKVLTEISKALKAGGGLLVTVPHHRFLWSEVDEASRHVRRYSRTELVEKLRRSGFEVVLVTSFSSFLVPLMVFSRRASRGRAEDCIFRQFLIPRWMNVLLEKVLGFERLLIKAGVRFPVGGSLFVVARRADETGESTGGRTGKAPASAPETGLGSAFSTGGESEEVRRPSPPSRWKSLASAGARSGP
jgi:SAM-dependent methyltransferase